MGLAQTKAKLRDRASIFIKTKLKCAKMNCADFAKKLKEHGLSGELETTIKAKLKRETFAAKFLLAILAEFEIKELILEDIL